MYGRPLCVICVGDTCVDMCADTSVNMCADMCTEMRVDMRVDMCATHDYKGIQTSAHMPAHRSTQMLIHMLTHKSMCTCTHAHLEVSDVSAAAGMGHYGFRLVTIDMSDLEVSDVSLVCSRRRLSYGILLPIDSYSTLVPIDSHSSILLPIDSYGILFS